MTTKTTTTAGQAVTLSDGTGIMSGEPEWKTIQRLDSRQVSKVWKGVQVERLLVRTCEAITFGELRRMEPRALEKLCSESLLHRLSVRFSSLILCGCGEAYMLHKGHVTCERPGCTAFGRLEQGRVALLRNAFPDQITHVPGE